MRAKKQKLKINSVFREIPTYAGKVVVREWEKELGFELQRRPLELHPLAEFQNLRFKENPWYGSGGFCIVGDRNGKTYLIYQHVSKQMKKKLKW